VSAVITNRIQTNISAKLERRLLTWLCGHIPAAIEPDHLTMFGVSGAFMVFTGYLLSWMHPAFLWLAVTGFVAHWFGDSLDGSLARFRRIERPRYGYFLDHSVDAFCNFIIMMSFGATQYARLDVSLLALCGYFMMCMYVFLTNKISNTFQLTFLAFGPTELRIGLIGLTIGMYFFGPVGLQIGKQFLSAYDLVILATSCVFVTLFITNSLTLIMRLRDEEKVIPVASQSLEKTAIASARQPPAQNTSLKLSA